MTSLLNPQPPPNPSPNLAALRVVFILLGLFTAFLVAVFVVGFVQGFTRAREPVQAVLPDVKKALDAPGAAELRDAGCPYPMVMKAEELRTMISKVTGTNLKLNVGVAAGVLCFGPDQLPDCGTLARAFVSSPGHVPGGFFVLIERKPAPRREVLCQRRFSDAAEDLGEYNPSTLDQSPP